MLSDLEFLNLNCGIAVFNKDPQRLFRASIFSLRPSWGARGWACEVAAQYRCPVSHHSPAGRSPRLIKVVPLKLTGDRPSACPVRGPVSLSPAPIPAQTSILGKSTFLS